jgi:hypothetical protein
MSDLWLLLFSLQEKIEKSTWSNGKERSSRIHLMITRLVNLLVCWTGLRKGSRIHDHSLLCQAILSLFSAFFHKKEQEAAAAVVVVAGEWRTQSSLQLALCRLLVMYLIYSPSVTMALKAAPCLKMIQESNQVGVVMTFYDTLYKNGGGAGIGPSIIGMLLPDMIGHIQRSFSLHSPRDQTMNLILLTNLFHDTGFKGLLSQHVSHSHKMNGGLKTPGLSEDILTFLNQQQQQQMEKGEELVMLSQVILATSALGYLDLVFPSFLQIMMDQVSKLKALLAEDGEDYHDDDGFYANRKLILQAVLGHVIYTVADVALRTGSQGLVIGMWEDLSLPPPPQDSCLSNQGFMKGFAKLAEAVSLTPRVSEFLGVEELEKVYEAVKENLTSVQPLLRLYTLSLLSCFSQHQMIPNKESIHVGEAKVFSICLEIERIPNTPEFEREKPIHLRKLDSLLQAHVLQDLYKDCISRYALALLSIHFSPLWSAATQTLIVASRVAQKQFWPIFEGLFVVLAGDPENEDAPYTFPKKKKKKKEEVEGEEEGEEEEEEEEEVCLSFHT